MIIWHTSPCTNNIESLCIIIRERGRCKCTSPANFDMSPPPSIGPAKPILKAQGIYVKVTRDDDDKGFCVHHSIYGSEAATITIKALPISKRRTDQFDVNWGRHQSVWKLSDRDGRKRFQPWQIVTFSTSTGSRPYSTSSLPNVST